MNIFEQRESEVRSYCRSFPVVFEKAQGSVLFDENGNQYLDFLSGAGTLNYGHNHPEIKESVMDFLQSDGLLHGLDMATDAKRNFLRAFQEKILGPRNLNYKIQFTGPTGTNAVEAAMKLARKVTGRPGIISFTNGFHGVSLGSLAATANSYYRDGAGAPLNHVTHMPFDGYFGPEVDTTEYLERFLEDGSSGVDLPAAVILETVQGEGGLNVASVKWLRRLQKICRKFEILMIIDDIQVGCGRTGPFFSFEASEIKPDIITLSKSLSGFGLPFSIVLIKPELDQWNPGEHNGTFRGNNLAFVSATAALKTFWEDHAFSHAIKRKGALIREKLENIATTYPEGRFRVKGKGLIQGIASEIPGLSKLIREEAFQENLVIETSGAQDQVLKVLPPLTIEEDQIHRGLEIIDRSIGRALERAKDDVKDNIKRVAGY